VDQGDHPARRRNPRGQGERLREELIEAAGALVAESGDGRQLSLRGVANRVGIAATSVYLHFPDVEHLKVAVVQRGYAKLDRVRDAASQGIADPVEALLARCRAYSRFALDHPGHYRLMFGPDLPASLAYDAERAPGRQALQTLAHSIQRCQQAGVARAGTTRSTWRSWSGRPCTGWSRCGWTGPSSPGRHRSTRRSTRPSDA
jgi:AcrR family transcriptional regulator